MNPSEAPIEASQVVEVNRADRWLIYKRLQELSIPCACATNQPLQVQIDNPTAAIQLWSVCQQMIAPRDKLLVRIKRCWQISGNWNVG